MSQPTQSPTLAPIPAQNGEVATVITGLISSDGCADVGPELGNTNLYDGVISDFLCPAAIGGIVPPQLVISADSSIVTGIRVYANVDFPPGDPKTFSLSGRLSTDAEWESIVLNAEFDEDWTNGGVIAPPPDRNPINVMINSTFEMGDPSLSFGEALIDNTRAFSEYRIEFPTTLSYPADGSTIYQLRVAEVGEWVILLIDA